MARANVNVVSQFASHIVDIYVTVSTEDQAREGFSLAEQEMATYIENIDVLDKMIDVCSDMTAQQYGVNVSMEQATNVAARLGKALANGDYSFLTKLGYGFTDAQKEMMKTGTETQRVATIMDVVGDSIGGVNKALTETTSGKIFQMTTAFGDLQKILANNVTPIIDKYVPKITELMNAFIGLDSETQQGILKMLAFGAATGPAAIVGLLLVGLGVAQSQFGEQLDQFLQIAIEKGPILIAQFTERIVAELPRLMDLGVQLLMTLVDVIIANLPVVINSAVQIITTLATGVADNAEILISKIVDLILMLVNSIVDNLPMILETGLKLLLALTQGIVNNIDKILDGILNVLLKLIDFIVDNLPMIIDMGIKIIIALAEGLVKAIPKIVASIPQIISAIFDAFKKIDWGSIGKSIIDGLVAGLKAAKDLVVNTLKNIVTGAIDAFKKFFGIKSPSRVFMTFGNQIHQGLAIGLDDNLNKVEDSMDNLMDTVNLVPDGLDYELTGLKSNRNKSVSQINNNTNNKTTNKNVNIYLTIEHFENNREEDCEEFGEEK